MSSASEHTGDSFCTFTTRFWNWVTFGVVLLILLVRQPPTASEETDCREMSGNGATPGPGPDTCTVQLTLNDTESGIISSLIAKYQYFPLGCRLRKYMIIAYF